jgi:hypothetical protein
MDGLTDRLADDVPERVLEAARGRAPHDPAADSLGRLNDRLDVERPATEGSSGQRLDDPSRRRVVARVRRLAPANQAVVGLDPDEDPVAAVVDADGPRADPSDPHGGAIINAVTTKRSVQR